MQHVIHGLATLYVRIIIMILVLMPLQQGNDPLFQTVLHAWPTGLHLSE